MSQEDKIVMMLENIQGRLSSIERAMKAFGVLKVAHDQGAAAAGEMKSTVAPAPPPPPHTPPPRVLKDGADPPPLRRSEPVCSDCKKPDPMLRWRADGTAMCPGCDK